MQVEWEREKGLRERSEREKVGVERELESEKARCKELEHKLKIELDRGRVARDDANKSRNALAFIRTQSIVRHSLFSYSSQEDGADEVRVFSYSMSKRNEIKNSLPFT